MCKKRNSKRIKLFRPIRNKKYRLYRKIKVDSCIDNLISFLNMQGIKTLGCCCGHGKYNLSIFYRSLDGKVKDLVSGVEIQRKRRFYITDKKGYYYIPELMGVKI